MVCFIGHLDSFVLQNYLSTSLAVRTIRYSEFLKALRENKVAEVAITAGEIQGKMNPDKAGAGNGEKFKTIRVDPEIFKILEQHNVTFKRQVESTFLRNLFSWISPIFLFIGTWHFFYETDGGPTTRLYDTGKEKGQNLYGGRTEGYL
jgi:cell division protease FtsH